MNTIIQHWLPTGQAAASLAISAKTLKRYADLHDFLIEGKHWRFGPLSNSPRQWNVEACADAARLDLAHGHHWDRLMPVRITVGQWFGGALWNGCEGLYGDGELDGNCRSDSNPEMQWNQEGQAWEVKADWWCVGSDLRDHWDGWMDTAQPDPPPPEIKHPLGPRPLRALFPASPVGLERLQEAINVAGSGAALGASLGVSQSAVSFRLKTLREKFSEAA